jgi:60 kDa SS-A/Ro ribonucleoprotein
MARLNTLKLNTAPRTHEGTPTRHISPEMQLRRSVLACLLWESQFYEDGVEIAGRIAELVPKVAAEKVAALALEAREQMKLRHAPLLLVREMARHKAHRAPVSETLARVIQRADELAEFIAIYWKDGRVPLSGQVKKGLAAAFPKFDEYQLAKYDRGGPIKLRDVLFLCHAKPRDEAQAAVWKRLIWGRLTTPDTWEVALSVSGASGTLARGADKRETWERLLREQKLGALALLRNLRNMREAGVSEKLVIAALREMKTDRVLPFRFIAAARYAPHEPELEQAMFRSLKNQPPLPGKTALVLDTSPSMWMARLSRNSDMDRFEAAAGLAILLRETAERVNVYAFNEKAYEVPPRRGFALRDALAATKNNWSRGGLAVAAANRDGYDRIIVITDGQWHFSDTTAVQGYGEGDPQTVAPKPLTERAYMINVASYKNGVGYGKWMNIDGWSDSVIEYIRALEGSGWVN